MFTDAMITDLGTCESQTYGSYCCDLAIGPHNRNENELLNKTEKINRFLVKFTSLVSHDRKAKNCPKYGEFA